MSWFECYFIHLFISRLGNRPVLFFHRLYYWQRRCHLRIYGELTTHHRYLCPCSLKIVISLGILRQLWKVSVKWCLLVELLCLFKFYQLFHEHLELIVLALLYMFCISVYLTSTLSCSSSAIINVNSTEWNALWKLINIIAWRWSFVL